jgi:polar amino acid transport system substrate-binding protein
MQAGQIEAILQDCRSTSSGEQDENFQIVAEFDTGEQYGFAFLPTAGNDRCDAVNDGLQQLRDDGTYDEIYERYFSGRGGVSRVLRR